MTDSPTASRLSVVFVDDEPNVLKALSNTLRRCRSTWDMAFILGGRAAVQHLDSARVEVVVSDSRMPEVDGEAVLQHARSAQPHAARIILSGQTDVRSTKRLVNLAHQFLAKPSDADTLIQVVSRSAMVMRRMHSPELQAVLGQLGQLPSTPAVWQRLTELFESPDAALRDAAAIVETDPALSAKVLQVVNSAFFGLPQRMASVANAVAYLGFEPLRSLVLWQEVSGAKVSEVELARWQARAFRVATVCRSLMGKSTAADRETAFTAGLLADIGTLALAASGRATDGDGHEGERTHAAVSAYLLGLWGLPATLVEAVAAHHDDASANVVFDVPTTVWLADALVTATDAGDVIRMTELANAAQRWGLQAELARCQPQLTPAAPRRTPMTPTSVPAAPPVAAVPASGAPRRPRVMCVDDEPLLLEGLSPFLRRHFEVVLCGSPEEALRKLADAPVSVIVSDMHMPGMSGIELLGRVREQWPDTVRVLLTGNADLQSAIAAVNQGQLFRFLTKPCPAPQVVATMQAAVEQHRLATAERELLELTVRGAIDALVDVLAMASPAAFGRGRRIKAIAAAIATELKVPDGWVIEIAAELAQLGSISLPPETAERLHRGQELSAAEKEMVARVPAVTHRLLAHIPRLERVWEVMAQTRAPLSAQNPAARVLSVASEFDALSSRGAEFEAAARALVARGTFDPAVLAALSKAKGIARQTSGVRELAVAELKPGMVLAGDVVTRGGALLLVKESAVSEGMVERLRNIAQSGGVKEPVRVWDDAPS